LSMICWRVSNQDYNSAAYSGVDTFWVVPGASAETKRAFPLSYGISNGCPNPFKSSAMISIAVPERGHGLQSGRVSVKVYNFNGVLVTTLADGPFEPGCHQIAFNGNRQNGESLPSGIYFCKMQAGEYKKTIRLIMMK
jgi:hypothetical protein